MPEVSFHRGTVMTFRRDCVSQAAARLIEIMRGKHLRSGLGSAPKPAVLSATSAAYEIDSRSA